MGQKEDQQLKEELSKIAEKRVKKLEGLTRRDREKMVEINEEYEEERAAILEKHGKAVTAANLKASAAESAKKQRDAIEADKKAAAKQDKKKEVK